MLVKIVSENATTGGCFLPEHGLSIYIETGKHRLLFDTGGGSVFVNNAKELGVNIADIDTLIISHGHYDHGGGLRDFLSLNTDAEIFMHEKAFGDYYAKRPGNILKYIGLDKELRKEQRFLYVERDTVIDDEMCLLTGVFGKEHFPSGNRYLFERQDGVLKEDLFAHEINLLINEGKKSVLIAGCAHSGILNIIAQCKERTGEYPTHVIGGFHLYSHGYEIEEDPKTVDEIADRLNATNSVFYTGHCTGEKSFAHLKRRLNDKMNRISSGSIFEI